VIYFLSIAAALLIVGVIVSESQINASSAPANQPNPPNAVVGAIANAIATAEGFFTGAGSVPFDQNNPGDLSDYADLYGANANGITIFPTIEAGWNALYEKIENILSGASSTYSADSPLSVLGSIWSGGDPNWASNVASELGISSDQSLNDYASSAGDAGDGGSD